MLDNAYFTGEMRSHSRKTVQ